MTADDYVRELADQFFADLESDPDAPSDFEGALRSWLWHTCPAGDRQAVGAEILRRRTPRCIAMWLPRADEHELAASLGMCESDPELLRELVAAAQREAAEAARGVPVRVHRWHVWRVVRAMARAGLTNTPEGRAEAFARLSGGQR